MARPEDIEVLDNRDFSITFSPDLTPHQIRATLEALADYYRVCGGVGFEIDFETETVFVGEPINV
jgi:hypothetical protein